MTDLLNKISNLEEGITGRIGDSEVEELASVPFDPVKPGDPGAYVAYALLRCANAIDRCAEQFKRIAERSGP